MSTRLYKINGEYNTFEYWHDHYGYTRTPTFSVQYKTTNPWGAAFASGGYYGAEDLMDIFTFSFFVPGVVGWNGIDDLALVGYYPAAATDLTVYREGVASNAASLAGDDGTYYLVERDINQGWMTEEEMFARGWEFIIPNSQFMYGLMDSTSQTELMEFDESYNELMNATGYLHDHADFVDDPNLSWLMNQNGLMVVYVSTEGFNYVVVDFTTGNILLHQEGSEMEYAAIQTVLLEDENDYITVYETGVPVESFYFTTNGRSETENTNISHADIPVYLEDGTAPAADTPYNGSAVMAFMDVDGNTKQADGESLYLDDGVLRLDAPDTDEGEQWAALVEHIEPAPSELTAYFTNKGAAATKGINLGGGSSYLLYDSSGAPIDASEYMTGAAVDVVPWTIINMYYFDGSALSSSDINKFNLAVGPSIGNGQLVLHPKSNISSYIYNVFRVVFTKPEPPADYNLKVYGQNGDTISLSIENNFMYVFDEPNNRYIMLNGGTSSTIWEIVSIIDTNGNEVSKESDYIWWINGSNIYYKASPTRPVTAAYILLKATPPIS